MLTPRFVSFGGAGDEDPRSEDSALLDAYSGAVIGVNTAMIPQAQSICFATGINTAKWVIGQLFAHGRVRRAYIGVSGATVPVATRVVRHFNLPSASAVHVLEIVAGCRSLKGSGAKNFLGTSSSPRHRRRHHPMSRDR